jgi:hypothetical protein
MDSEQRDPAAGFSTISFGDGICIDPLSSYVLHHHAYFMTTSEHWAMDKLRADFHARAYGFESYELQQLHYRDHTIEGHSDLILKRLYRHRDPTVQRHLADGVEIFFLRARQRILREHADEIDLKNYPEFAAGNT